MQRTFVAAAALAAVIAISAFEPASALAQRGGRGPRGGGPRGVVFVGGYFYDPFFGPYPWWGPGMYAYPYFPVYDDRAQVRVMATPKEAAVYVDGYYAGIVDDFDGAFQSLPLSPGAHEITLFLDGYQTAHQSLYLPPRKSYKLRYAMQPLAAGEKSDMPPVAPPVPPPPPGSAMVPRQSPYAAPITGTPLPAASGFGTLSLRVQPGDAEILIDGERWNPSAPGERLTVQMTLGAHHIEIRRAGYRSFTTDITVQAGAALPLNVSLSAQ